MKPHFFSADEYFKETFGKKMFRLSLDGGMTCPNRDGKAGTGGCSFCSASGSGDFAQKRTGTIAEQIAAAKDQVKNKLPKNGAPYRCTNQRTPGPFFWWFCQLCRFLLLHFLPANPSRQSIPLVSNSNAQILTKHTYFFRLLLTKIPVFLIISLYEKVPAQPVTFRFHH